MRPLIFATLAMFWLAGPALALPLPQTNSAVTTPGDLPGQGRLAGQHLDQPIEIILAFVERLHPNPFVPAVDPAAVIDITGEPGVAVGRNARVSQKASIRGT